MLQTYIFNSITILGSKNLEQAICLRTDEWIRKLQNIYSRGYYSAIKEYASLQFAAAWTELLGYHVEWS